MATERPTAEAKYPFTMIALHWLTLLLIAGAYASMEFRDIFERGTPAREAMKSAHYVLGLTILAIALARIAIHFVARTPPIVPSPPVWQKIAAHGVHIALFAVMIVLPVLGWSILSAEGASISYLGLELPPLIAADKPLAKDLEEVHETIANIGYGLIGVHAAAALYHHYVAHDNTLVRMLPWKASA